MRSMWLTRPARIVLVCALVAPARSQHHFDPAADLLRQGDLPGFQEAFDDGRFSFLYGTHRFEAEAWAETGKSITPERLEEILRLWREECEMARPVVELAERDPALFARVKKCHVDLSTHPFFRETRWDYGVAHPPFVFVVERSTTRRREYFEAVAAKYAPWLENLRTHFATDYVGPLDLRLRPDMGEYAIVILLSRAAYDRYADKSNTDLQVAGAHYDPLSRLAYTYEDAPLSRVRTIAPERLVSILHEFVHALADSYASPEPRGRAPLWFVEGLPEYLAGSDRRDRKLAAMFPPDLPEGRMRNLAAALLDEAQRDVLVSSIDDLTRPESYGDVVSAAQKRAGRPLDGREAHGSLAVFYAQAGAFMSFLHAGHEGRYRDRLRTFLADVLGDREPRDAFARAFADIDRESLWIDFWSYFWQHAKNLPGVQAPTVIWRPGSGPVFDAARLALGDDETDALLCLGLLHARDGRFREGVAVLERAATRSAGADPRIARELERMKRAADLKERVLRTAIEKGWRLRIADLEGSDTLYVPKRTSDDVLHVVTTTGLERELPASAFGPDALYENARRRRDYGMLPWVGDYLRLLADPSNVSSLTGRDAKRVAARDDAGDYEERLKRGALVLALGTLGRPTSTSKEKRERLAALAEVLREGGTWPFVASRRGALRDLAATLVAGTFDPANPDHLVLNGVLTAAGPGRVRVSYDFSDARQAEDFEPFPGFLGPGRSNSAPVSVAGGVLRLRGGAIRHALPLTGPLDLVYEVSMPTTPPDPPALMIGLFDEPRRSLFFHVPPGELHAVVDGARAFDGGEPAMLPPGQMHHFQWTQIGGETRMVSDRTRASVAPGFPHMAGRFFLEAGEGDLTLKTLVIEGSIGQDAPELLKRRYENRELEALGL